MSPSPLWMVAPLLGCLFAGATIHPARSAPAPAPALEPGLVCVVRNAGGGSPSETETFPVALLNWRVARNESPTPFLASGPHEVEWTGWILAELSGSMVFQASCLGSFALEINGETVLVMDGNRDAALISGESRLRKGTNAIRAFLRSASSGPTGLRVSWGEDPSFLEPIPSGAFRHDPRHAGLAEDSQRRRGRELFIEHRCAACHAAKLEHPIPDLAMGAPSFLGIGRRLNASWMEEWILNPKSERPSGRMPKVLNGPGADIEAKAISQFLASLIQEPEPEATPGPARAALDTRPASVLAPFEALARAPLFERYQCGVCHVAPGLAPSHPPRDDLISLNHLTNKFKPGQLADYLRRPEAHFPWTRMPNFRLDRVEASQLAVWLGDTLREPSGPAGSPAPAEAELLDRGRDLIQTKGCLNCHALDLPNRYEAPALDALRDWTAGCLASGNPEEAPAPRFEFTDVDREALQAFGRAGAADSLGRHVPAEFASRHTQSLRCEACHAPLGAPFRMEMLGAKLKTEWVTRLLEGELDYKPRPWLPVRMPAFASRARWIAGGLAHQHGYDPVSFPEAEFPSEWAAIGRQLTGKVDGFSCVSCHAVADQKAMEAFEVEGINLSHVSDRLRFDFFRRWLTHPSSVDPQTKMPAYFEDGSSPLVEVLEGDADRQIGALWEYLKQLKSPD